MIKSPSGELIVMSSRVVLLYFISEFIITSLAMLCSVSLSILNQFLIRIAMLLSDESTGQRKVNGFPRTPVTGKSLRNDAKRQEYNYVLVCTYK